MVNLRRWLTELTVVLCAVGVSACAGCSRERGEDAGRDTASAQACPNAVVRPPSQPYAWEQTSQDIRVALLGVHQSVVAREPGKLTPMLTIVYLVEYLGPDELGGWAAGPHEVYAGPLADGKGVQSGSSEIVSVSYENWRSGHWMRAKVTRPEQAHVSYYHLRNIQVNTPTMTFRTHEGRKGQKQEFVFEGIPVRSGLSE